MFPEEVLLLRADRQIKKTVLISNFVDRESERPSIGPSDFALPKRLPISECRSNTRDKKTSRYLVHNHFDFSLFSKIMNT